MSIEDQLPPLLWAAADSQPDAPYLFEAVSARVRRRQHRRRVAAAVGTVAIVAAAVTVPVVASSLGVGGQRTVTVPAGRSAISPVAPLGPRCPTTTSVLTRPQPGTPDTQLFPDGATALTVCRWRGGGGPAGGGTYRLASTRPIPSGQVAADLAALNTLTSGAAFRACSSTRPWVQLAIVAGYPGGGTFIVQLVAPCDEYLTNGTVDATTPQSVVTALTSGGPLPSVASGVLVVHVTLPDGSRPTYDNGVFLSRGHTVYAVLPRRPDGSYRARVPVGTYTLQAFTTNSPEPCTGHALVGAEGTTSAAVTCPISTPSGVGSGPIPPQASAPAASATP